MKDLFSLPVFSAFPIFLTHTRECRAGCWMKQSHLEGSVTPRRAGGRWGYTQSQGHASKDVSDKEKD